jgi:HEPN domain-containing protein
MEWLRRARSNLSRAKADRDLPEVLYEDLCFDAQQAAEKSLKAVLVHRRLGFPRTHDINVLLGLLRNCGVDVPDEICQADSLTGFAVDTRYPGLTEPVTRAEYEQALELAQRVLRWAESIILGAAEQ